MVMTGVLVAASIIVIVTTLVLVVKEKRRTRDIKDHIAMLEAHKQQYERKNIALKDRIAYLQSDRAYETEAKRMNYKNPDEQVAIVRRTREDDAMTQTTDDVQEPPKAEQKHYEIWYEYFFR